MRIGNSIINPYKICSAQIVEKKDWLGLVEGYIIRCNLIDGRVIDIRDDDGDCFCHLVAKQILDDINYYFRR